MKVFVSRITTAHWTLKNKAQKQARAMARSIDCRLIAGEDLQKFKDGLSVMIQDINKSNPRCKDLYLSFWKEPGEKASYNVICPGIFHMEIFEADPSSVLELQEVLSYYEK